MLESELLDEIKKLFSRRNDSVEIGIGDDGAVYIPKGKQVVVSDVAVEGVHFRCDWSTYQQIGRKVTAANLADIFVMGGVPRYLLVALVLPERHLSGALEIASGIANEADLVGAQVIGGDLSTGNELTISITAIGEVTNSVGRDGAKIGDRVLISELPGASAAGLDFLRSGDEISNNTIKNLVDQHLAPSINYKKYRDSIGKFNSAIDTSDGLLVDAFRIAQASKVKIHLSTENLKSSQLHLLNPERFLDWVLSGGEDHKLLGTSNEEIDGFTEIGKVEAGSGIYLDGNPISVSGYEHRWKD